MVILRAHLLTLFADSRGPAHIQEAQLLDPLVAPDLTQRYCLKEETNI